MKRSKKLTRKEKRVAAALLANQPKPIHPPFKQENMLRASFYLARKEQKKHEKQHLRQDKQEAKEANKYKMRKLTRLAEAASKLFKNKSHEQVYEHQHEEGSSHVH